MITLLPLWIYTPFVAGLRLSFRPSRLNHALSELSIVQEPLSIDSMPVVFSSPKFTILRVMALVPLVEVFGTTKWVRHERSVLGAVA